MLVSKHHEILGGVAALLHAGDADMHVELLPAAEERRRIRVKSTASQQHVPGAADINALLQVFAIAAFVELTEKWHALPHAAPGAPKMVCNMAADEVRTLAKLVDEERAVSAQPLVEHVCAMCGHLLQSRAREGWTEVDIGKPGEAHQSRGQKCDWDELPPVLLLFSKDTLAR